MNFLHLYYFTVVAEELNITKAAERLYISQQSLSSHILKLENELNVKLLNRGSSISLTYAGTRLLRSANQILDIKRQIMSEMDDIANHRRGELRVGISHTRGLVMLPKVLPNFCQDHPFVDISVTEGNSQQLEEWLQHGKIDLLIGFAPIMVDVAEIKKILQERLYLVVPRAFIDELYPKADQKLIEDFQKGVSIDAFQNCKYLLLPTGNRTRTIFDQHLTRQKISVNIVLEMESIETLLTLSCKGMGITVYPEMFLKNLGRSKICEACSSVCFFPLNDPATIGSLVIAYHRNRFLSDAAKDFIESLMKIDYFNENELDFLSDKITTNSPFYPDSG